MIKYAFVRRRVSAPPRGRHRPPGRFGVNPAAPLALALIVGCAPEPGTNAPASDPPIVGVWRLVSWERRMPDGEVTLPYGETPGGQIAYLGNGRMSAQLMRPDRVFPDTATSTAEEMRAFILGSFFSYYGDYTVDLEAGVVTHHVEGALHLEWLDSDRPRAFRLEGRDRLILSTAPDPQMEAGGVNTLHWERIPSR